MRHCFVLYLNLHSGKRHRHDICSVDICSVDYLVLYLNLDSIKRALPPDIQGFLTDSEGSLAEILSGYRDNIRSVDICSVDMCSVDICSVDICYVDLCCVDIQGSFAISMHLFCRDIESI